MIGSIRNKWLRRAALVTVLPFLSVLAAGYGAGINVVDLWRDAWRVWTPKS